MKIIIKDYSEFVKDIEMVLENKDYYDTFQESLQDGIRDAVKNIIQVEIREETKKFVERLALKIIFPLVKKKMEEDNLDEMVAFIIKGIQNEVIEMAAEIEKNHIKLNKYIP